MRCAPAVTSTTLAIVLVFAVAEASRATLIGLWRFDESSGTVASDSSGNGLDGVLRAQDSVSLPVWIGGRTGLPGDGALRFGVGAAPNMVAVDYDQSKAVMDSPSGTNAFTIAAWISSEQANEVPEGGGQASQWGRIFQRIQWSLYGDGRPGVDSLGMTVNLREGNVDLWDDLAPGTDVPVSVNSATSPAWTHVGVSYDGTDIKFYVNAIEKYAYTPDAALGPIRGDWWGRIMIGNEDPSGIGDWRDPYLRQFVGAIDDMAYFDTALTPAQLGTVMSGDFSGFSTRPVEGAHGYGAAVAALQPTHHYRFGTTGVVAPDSGFGATPIDGVLHSDRGGADLNSTGPGESDGLPGFIASPANGAMGPRDVGTLYLGDGTNWAADQMTFSGWVGLASGTGTVVWDRVFTNSQSYQNFQIVIHDDGASVSEPAGLYITTEEPLMGVDAILLPKSVVDLVDEQWHHLFVVRDGNGFANTKVVIDGQDYTSQLVTPPAIGFIPGNEWGTAMLGGLDAYSNQLSGLMDEVSIWVGQALTVQDGIDLYNAALTSVNYIPGDANRDGAVDEKDAKVLAAHWGKTGASWMMGDFDKDGIVGPADAAILAAHWGRTTLAESSKAVPEPSTLALLAFGIVGLLATFRRGRR